MKEQLCFNRADIIRLWAMFIIVFQVSTTTPCLATIKIDGTPAQMAKISDYLTKSLGTTVTAANDGTLSIANGGNASATRLRNMIADAATSVTLKIVVDDPSVSIGAWRSSDATNAKGTTTGTQLIDITDLENIGNVLNGFGLTPDCKLMHEITEVYEGKKNNLVYEDAHKIGIDAEVEELKEHGASYVGPRYFGPDQTFSKLKLPDGTYVIVEITNSYKKGEKRKWYREKVPCNTTSGLIAIPDPDPMVHLWKYNFDSTHTRIYPIDQLNSSPTGVDFIGDSIWVCENFRLNTMPDELRCYNKNGLLVRTIQHPDLIDPEGLTIDKVTGDIFVPVRGKVLRFNKGGILLGSYFTGNPAFMPTDVAILRGSRNGFRSEGIFLTSRYDLYVTDRTNGKVYVFHAHKNLNTGKYYNVFGKGILSAPEGIFIDSWYSVWVASTGNNKIVRFTPGGKLEPFGSKPYFVLDSTRKFNDMAMIDFDGLYAVDGTSGNGSLLHYAYDGTLLTIYEGMQCPTSIAVNISMDANNLIPIEPPGGDGGGKINKSMNDMEFDHAPDAPFLISVYPNPAEGILTIEYELTQSSIVYFIVYDATGKELDRINLNHQAPGVHQASYNTQSLKPGTYKYIMEAGSEVVHGTFVK